MKLHKLSFAAAARAASFRHKWLPGPPTHVELRCLINLSQLAAWRRPPSALRPTPSIVNGGRSVGRNLHRVPNDVSKALTRRPHISMVMLITQLPQACLECKPLQKLYNSILDSSRWRHSAELGRRLNSLSFAANYPSTTRLNVSFDRIDNNQSSRLKFHLTLIWFQWNLISTN